MKTSIKIDYIDKLQNINLSFNNGDNSVIVSIDNSKQFSVGFMPKNSIEVTMRELHSSDVEFLREVIEEKGYTSEEINIMINIVTNCLHLPKIDDSFEFYSFLMTDKNSFMINQEFTSVKSLKFENDNHSIVRIGSRIGAITLSYVSSEQLGDNLEERLREVGLTPESYDYMRDYVNRMLDCLNAYLTQPVAEPKINCNGKTCKLDIF